MHTETDIYLRPATDSDIPNMFKWEMESIDKRLQNDPKVIQYIKNDAKESVWKTRMIMCGENTIGMLTAYYKDGYWYIGEIYLINEFRGKGIGSKLLRDEISQHDKLSLQVAKDNKGAFKLYKSLGFEVYDETDYSYHMRLIKDKTSYNESNYIHINSYMDHITQNLNQYDSVESLRTIAEKIFLHVKNTSKPPTGNQNCQLCTWCTEAQLRGYDVLPRPVYSPRDPVLNIKGETIVKNPIKQSLKSGINSLYNLTNGGSYGRWYCHVNWAGSSGGHEFILIKMNGSLYVMDSQQGIITDIETKVGRSYFDNNINWENSYITRLDDKEFNYDMFISNNDPSKTLQWDEEKDIEYMRQNDMLPKEESTVQEGALQDIRNGVNPKSKKLFFHISMDDKLNGKTLYPRIPTYLTEGGSQSDTYEEDATIKRVCFSPSIEGCLNAIISVQRNLDIVNKNIYVYIPEKPISEYKIKTNKELIKEKLVFDATTTGEMWILEPVKMKLYGVITVDKVKSITEKKTVSGILHGRYDYKWHWSVHPRVIERTYERYPLYDNTKSNDTVNTEYFVDNEGVININTVYQENKHERVNDKGETVPETCDKCGSKIGLYLKGEPVWLCSNKKCDQYYGTAPCNINEYFNYEKEEKHMSSFTRNPFFIQENKEIDIEISPNEDIESNEELEKYDDNDLDTFGSDNDGTSPNNDYDQEEINTLNELIASESSAIGEYLDAAKKTNVDILRRLYSDIGDEERFHSEQLMFAKASLTGEKYEPRDPEVKKEYEELLEMGMDEETAMTTAIDKHGLRGSDDVSEVDMEELEKDIEVLEYAVNQYSLNMDMLTMICESSDDFRQEDLEEQIDIFIEQFCFMEATHDVSPNSGSIASGNPFKLIINGFRALLRFIKNIANKIKVFIKRITTKSRERNAWIKKHGIKGLFQSGVHLYFYDDTKPSEVDDGPLLYLELLNNIMQEISKSLNIPESFKNINVRGTFSSSKMLPPIQFKTIEDGLQKAKNVILTKSKVIVTDKNEAEITKIFFGIPGNGNLNIYMSLEAISEVFNKFAKSTEDFLKAFEDFQKNSHSIYYTNRELYNTRAKNLKEVNGTFNVFMKALTHDLKELVRLNNKITGESVVQNSYENMNNNKS